MKNTCWLLLLIMQCLLYYLPVQAQSTNPVDHNFFINQKGAPNALQFTPDLPELSGLAGAPAPFYRYFWIFGDGNYSREESPVHIYELPGTYDAYLLATGNYDKGKKPDKEKRQAALAAIGTPGETGPYANAIKEEFKSIGIEAARNPSPLEETIMVLSYRNNTNNDQSGQLHLFFNETRFGQDHFNFTEALTYYGEQSATQAIGYVPNNPFADYNTLAAVDLVPSMPILPSGPPDFDSDRDEVLTNAQNEFREHKTWSFSNLKPGETRNVFVCLKATQEMVEDTSVTIFLQSAFETADGQVFDHERLDIEIVSAHDPNVIAVSDTKVGYRRIGQNRLKYRTRFQNTGEGPAGTIKITTEIPEGLDIEELEVLDNYPKCPICPEEEVDWSCLDTLISDKELVFTFKNVYLPGTRQEGVGDRDSTKGFVYYRILPTKELSKVSFKSRASIVFDQEKPVVTNWATTRFKFEPSFGFQFGYRSTGPFDASTGENLIVNGNERGDFFFGLSVSDYMAYKIYYQPEIRLGVSNCWTEDIVRPDFFWSTTSDTTTVQRIQYYTVSDTTIGFSGDRNLIRYSVELVPLQFRKNITGLFALGLGASYNISLETGKERLNQHITQTSRRYERSPAADNFVLGKNNTMSSKTISNEKRHNAFSSDLNLFVDISVGKVRAGPAFGLRNYFRAGQTTRYAVEAYLTWKY